TFHFENLIMPPLTKTCPKMVLSHQRGSLCVKDAFAKKFFGAGRDSAGGACVPLPPRSRGRSRRERSRARQVSRRRMPYRSSSRPSSMSRQSPEPLRKTVQKQQQLVWRARRSPNERRFELT